MIVVVHIDSLQLARFVEVANILLAGMKDMQYTAKVMRTLVELMSSDDEMYVKMHGLIEMLEAFAERSTNCFAGLLSDDFADDGVIDDGFAIDPKDYYVPWDDDADSAWDEELGVDWDEIRDHFYYVIKIK
jgi:hypothetical protein